MSVKTAASKTGSRILSATMIVVTAVHDAPILEKIEAIDETIKTLQETRATLVDELIEKI